MTNKIAFISPPRTASTMFGSYIPEEMFCYGSLPEERMFIDGVGYISTYHRTSDDFAQCDHPHIWAASIRNPLSIAISSWTGFDIGRNMTIEKYLLEEYALPPSHYIKNKKPSDFEIILDRNDLKKSLQMFNQFVPIDLTEKPRYINVSESLPPEIDEKVQKEFKEKFSKDFELYYDFLNEFINRKMKINDNR